ncbi:MAG: hypothetical protein Kow0098_24680 [Ignavibacteriaceae bacterium]
MIPEEIKIVEKKKLSIKWNDESESVINLKYLRDQCPCASCKGETILLRTYRPPKPSVLSPEMYKVTNIDLVGDYAIQITWKDGHNTGIYSWDYLKKLEADQNEDKSQNYEPLI